MPFVVVAFLTILLVSGIVLIWEARTGRFASGSPRRDAGRAALFFLAAVSGAGLLIRTMGGGALVALALLPVTVLSLVRFVALARRWGRGWAPASLVALALLVGIGVSLLLVPEQIDHTYLARHIFDLDGGASARSIDPQARFSVRS